MTDTAEILATTREQAHEGARSLYAHAQCLLADGKRVRMVCGEFEEPLTIKQRKFLHGVVLPQISEQVRMPDGTRYVADVWKEHLKDLFLPDRWDMVRMPFVRDRKSGEWKPSTRKVPVKRRKSTEELSVKQYSHFIDQCIAHAATEWGVEFRFQADEREGVRYVAPVRKRAPEREAIAA